jgi:D-3-phosphoglycerate dehydrogenase / 2-oxoglutarate reductase
MNQNMPRILVSEDISGKPMDELCREFDVTMEPDLWKSFDKLKAAVSEFDALMVRNQTPVNAELIAAGKKLSVIARAGVGLDNIDSAAAAQAGVVVVYAPEQNAISVAELALGMMLALARMIPAADRSTKARKWERKRFVGTELYGKTLGLIGLGRIGFRTAMRARAFGMEVIAFDPQVSPDSITVTETRARLLPFNDVLAQADFISCHIPETPQTVGLFNYEAFSRMKPAAFFINTARGKVVDEAGLARALEEVKIAGAALDVRAKEPPDSPLSDVDNVILLPHVGAFTEEGQDRVVTCVCRDVAAVLRGQPAKSFFNFPRPRKGC